MNRPLRLPALVAWLGLVLAPLLAGCGYKSGFTLPDSRTIGVKVFGNDSKLRNLEMRLHPFLTDAVERMVAADLVSPSRADLWIEGVVTEYARRSGIRSPDNVLQESGVHIVVVARLVRRAEGGGDGLTENEVLRQVTVADERGYLLTELLGESRAADSAMRNIADRVVLDLMADLAYEDAPQGSLR